VNSSIQVEENFLDAESFDKLYRLVDHPYFPWHKENIIDPAFLGRFDFLCDLKLNTQFTLRLYDNGVVMSKQCPLIMKPFKDKLDIKKLVTAKINYNPVWSDVVEHSYHIDNPLKCKTAVFYLNSNDGYTAFESGEKIQSIANRIVIFDSSKKHTGTTCTDIHGRYVLNINYFTQQCLI